LLLAGAHSVLKLKLTKTSGACHPVDESEHNKQHARDTLDKQNPVDIGDHDSNHYEYGLHQAEDNEERTSPAGPIDGHPALNETRRIARSTVHA
jgi:hypothetical protein